MAIVVEEEKKSGGILGVLTWVVVIGILGAAAYYIFFKQPELVPIPTPQSFQSTAELSKIEINPQDIIGSQSFQSLKPYITPLAPQNVGRTNPFLGF